MATTTLPTVGNELPDALRSMATPAVLALPIDEAYAISQEGAPWPDGFTQKDADALDNLYAQYLSDHSTGTANAPFWNKTPEANQAFWAKRDS